MTESCLMVNCQHFFLLCHFYAFLLRFVSLLPKTRANVEQNTWICNHLQFLSSSRNEIMLRDSTFSLGRFEGSAKRQFCAKLISALILIWACKKKKKIEKNAARLSQIQQMLNTIKRSWRRLNVSSLASDFILHRFFNDLLFIHECREVRIEIAEFKFWS